MNTLFPFQRYSFNSENLFEDLPEEICDLLSTHKEFKYFEAGQTIFEEDTEPNGIYILKTGKVKKHTRTNFGKEHIFYICKEGEILGYHALLSQEPYPDSATALTDSKIAFIPKEDFLHAIRICHRLSDKLLKNLSHEFGVFINSTKILAKHTVRERTALNLLILEEKYSEQTDEPVEVMMSRDDLASMVGTAKESLVRMLHDFKEEGLITTSGRAIKIIDHQGLIKVANYR